MRVTDAQYSALLRAQAKPARQRTTLPARTEHDEQCAVIEWAHALVGRYPELRWLAHIPNGEARPPGVGARLKAAGTNAGIPDLLLPCPRGAYHGLFIELKTPTGRLSAAQGDWLDHLRNVGYMAVVCYGADEAIRTLVHYLTEGTPADE